MIVKAYDNLLRKAFRLAKGRMVKRIVLVVLLPFVIISHLLYGLKVGFETLMQDLREGWNYVEKK